MKWENLTKSEGRIKVGDKIEARVTLEGHGTSKCHIADSTAQHCAAFTEHKSDIPFTIP